MYAIKFTAKVNYKNMSWLIKFALLVSCDKAVFFTEHYECKCIIFLRIKMKRYLWL